MLSKPHDILARLMAALHAKTYADLARTLMVDPSAINAAIRSQRVPEAWLYKVAYQTRCCVEWLRTGQSPQYLDEAVAETRTLYGLPSLEEIGPLVEAWKDLSDDERKVIERSIELLRHGEADLMKDMLDFLDRRRQHSRTTRSGRPREKAALKTEETSLVDPGPVWRQEGVRSIHRASASKAYDGHTPLFDGAAQKVYFFVKMILAEYGKSR